MKNLILGTIVIVVLALSCRASATKSSLHQAVIDHNLDNVIMLINAGANVNSQDWMFGKSPLMLAAERGFTDIATALVNAGANLELRSRSRSTALHYAALHRHAETFHYLLLKGANLQAVNRRYEMPNGLACKNGWQDILSDNYTCKQSK